MSSSAAAAAAELRSICCSEETLVDYFVVAIIATAFFLHDGGQRRVVCISLTIRSRSPSISVQKNKAFLLMAVSSSGCGGLFEMGIYHLNAACCDGNTPDCCGGATTFCRSTG